MGFRDGRGQNNNVRLCKVGFHRMTTYLVTTNTMPLRMKGDTNPKGCWENRNKAGPSLQTRVYGHPGFGSGSKGWSVCKAHLSAEGRCTHPRPRGVSLSSWHSRTLPQKWHSLSCQNQHALCPPRLEWPLVIWSPSLHILLGVSQNVFCGSGPRNLPFPSVLLPPSVRQLLL